MVTCFFMGHNNLYDIGLYPDILKAVKQVVAQDRKIEFVFDVHTSFTLLCLDAVLEARQNKPNKSITITFVTRRDLERISRDDLYAVPPPLFLYDKIVMLPELTCDIHDAHYIWRSEKRELLDRCDYLIGYEYPDLQDTCFDLYRCAVRRPGLTVLSLTREETTKAIQESIEKLDTRQQYVLCSLKSGKNHKAIGEEFGVTGSAIRERELKCRRLLRSFAGERFKEQQENLVRTHLACAVVLPAKMDDEDEKRFRKAVKYLTATMGVTTFLVEYVSSNSEFVRCLFKINAFKSFRVELVTHYSDSVATTWGSTTEGFVPPFDDVSNVDSETRLPRYRYLRALSALLDRSEYVICKSTAYGDPLTPKQIRKHKKLKVFDLGRSQEQCAFSG